MQALQKRAWRAGRTSRRGLHGHSSGAAPLPERSQPRLRSCATYRIPRRAARPRCRSAQHGRPRQSRGRQRCARRPSPRPHARRLHGRAHSPHYITQPRATHWLWRRQARRAALSLSQKWMTAAARLPGRSRAWRRACAASHAFAPATARRPRTRRGRPALLRPPGPPGRSLRLHRTPLCAAARCSRLPLHVCAPRQREPMPKGNPWLRPATHLPAPWRASGQPRLSPLRPMWMHRHMAASWARAVPPPALHRRAGTLQRMPQAPGRSSAWASSCAQRSAAAPPSRCSGGSRRQT